jgi:predicted methyltransferase
METQAMNAITDRAHEFLGRHLRPGDAAVDATIGTGHDALFLAERVGPTGRVYGFDIQPEAIAQTGRRLEAANWTNVKLLLADHGRMRDFVPEPVRAIVFNLGYMPNGNRTITTRLETTIRALDLAVSLLQPGGVLTAIGYRGHPGGVEETDAVRAKLQRLSPETFEVEEWSASDSPVSPVLFVARKLTS